MVNQMFPIALSESNTANSLDFMAMINSFREEAGETPHEPRKFLAKIEDELDGLTGKKFRLNNNQTETAYYDLTKDQMMLVGMRESKIVRRRVLDVLNEMAKPSMPAIPQTYAEALQLAADKAKQLEEQAPKIEVYNRLAERTGDVSTTVVAKQLGTTAIKLNAWLRDKGMKWKNADLPMAGYMDWFNVISDVKNGHEFTQCLVTPKGQIEIAKRWESS